MHSGDSINLQGRFNSSYREVESDGPGQQRCTHVCMHAYVHVRDVSFYSFTKFSWYIIILKIEYFQQQWAHITTTPFHYLMLRRRFFS